MRSFMFGSFQLSASPPRRRAHSRATGTKLVPRPRPAGDVSLGWRHPAIGFRVSGQRPGAAVERPETAASSRGGGPLGPPVAPAAVMMPAIRPL